MSSTTHTYTVQGMTCDACARNVSEEVGAVAGIESVSVDLASGTVSVTAWQPVAADQIRDAVEEAGYRLAS